MTAREEILGRIRSALGPSLASSALPADASDLSGRAAVHVPQAYRSRPVTQTPDALVDRFVERVQDYRATVTRCAAADAASTIGLALPTGAHVVLPAGLPWEVAGTVDPGFSATELDGFHAVVTAATLGIAETGTIVLTHGPGEGRRAVTLVPDLHVCVVRADQVVADVPAAFRLLDPLRPQTWISGPSATSDIELNRVEGVHGPRTLHVLLLT